MTKRKFTKLNKTGEYGGNVYEYRGIGIHNDTSPNNPYGEWRGKGWAYGKRIFESHNTREQVAEDIDRTLARLDREMWDEIEEVMA